MEKISRYFRERIKNLSELKKCGVIVYPNFVATMSLRKLMEKYKDLEGGQLISLAGRVISKQKFKNFTIYHIQGGGETVRIKTEARISTTVMHGDVIGVVGSPGKKESGDFVIYPTSVQVLSPCLHYLPALPKELSSFSPGCPRDPLHYSLKPEARARYRFLYLILHKDVRKIFETRTMVISYIRKFLDDLDFLEVETPILNPTPGIGAGCPFVTHYKDKKLYMRVAPEVNLKKLLVGGLDRVYEIGKQFRNEGIDATHNPEFTSCELYMSYANYEDMMNLTEELLSGIVKEVTGSFIIKCNDLDNEPVDIDFTPRFRRVDFLEELQKVSGLSMHGDLGSEELNAYLYSACEKLGVKCDPLSRTARLLDKLLDHFIVPSCIHPTFVINHPKVMSLMAKSHESNPEITERFELYVNKQEICNAYTELNDTMEQKLRFAELLKELETGEYEAISVDEKFMLALEYGLPPCAGWGIGIDRLVMLLTYSRNIKDVLLFPLMKPQ